MKKQQKTLNEERKRKYEEDMIKRRDDEKLQAVLAHLEWMEEQERLHRPIKELKDTQMRKTMRERICQFEAIDKEVFGRVFL